MTRSNAAESVILSAMVPVLLHVNHERNGRTDGDDDNRGKATFGCVPLKIRLYESLVLSTLQYGAETWPMTVVNSKKLEAAHHKWLRRILGITWKQKVTNEEVRKRTGMGSLLNMLRRNRLRWLGHVHRMNNNRLPKQALQWSPRKGKRRRGRPRKNWKTTDTDDLRALEMSWEEFELVGQDRVMWRSCVARCAEGARTD